MQFDRLKTATKQRFLRLRNLLSFESIKQGIATIVRKMQFIQHLEGIPTARLALWVHSTLCPLSLRLHSTHADPRKISIAISYAGHDHS
jgi:hypothetical protein